ncbi:hypothetical protein LTR22_026979 [Elasticomyces elasticus]|nr:hypothetical protein LTR22_026979 [Elasticomyces elasticus]
MGQIYYDLGILATDEVMERSASDLVGQYVGHTGDKTKKLLESALGKVLLIDEAYRLASGDFAKEATDEFIDLLTKPRFTRELIVILAGYDHDIERLMATNPGLSSRFPERIPFQSLSPESCIMLLVSQLARERYLDITAIQDLPTSSIVVVAFKKLIRTRNWANARDVQSLANIFSSDILQAHDFSSTELFQVKEQHVMTVLQSIVDDRQRRAALLASSMDLHNVHQPQKSLIPSQSTQRQSTVAAGTTASTAQEVSWCLVGEVVNERTVERDEGVSDEVWTALMADKQKASEEEKLYIQIISNHKNQQE